VLPAVSLGEEVAADARLEIGLILEANARAPRALVEAFGEFQELVDLDLEAYVDDWAYGRHSLDETAAEIQRLLGLHAAVAAKSESLVRFKLMAVDVAGAQAELQSRALAARCALQAWVEAQLHAANGAVVGRFTEIKSRLREDPTNTEEMDNLERFVGAVVAELPAIAASIAESQRMADVLAASQHALSDATCELFYTLVFWPARLEGELEGVRERLHRFRNRFQIQLRADQETLAADLEGLQVEVEAFVLLGDLKAVDDRLNTAQVIEDRLRNAAELGELYQAREEIFGMTPRTEYPQIEVITKRFEPYNTLWKFCGEFARALPEWMDGPFSAIDAETLASDCDKWWRGSAKLMKSLDGAPQEVVASMRAQLEDFQQYIPLITALRNPGMRDRHWERISNACGFPVKADNTFSLRRGLQVGLPKYLPAVEEVSEYASKEYSLERTLDKMQGDWNGVMLEYMAWRNTGTYILRGLDEVQMLLDDQIVKTQSMRASPYIGPFEDRVRLWEATLNLTQEILDEWLKCQQGWLYLEPIFGSEDIMQQMPNEGRKFKAVDVTWRKSMERMIKNPEVLIVCGDEELLVSLNEANSLLDQVQKGLNDYLETKRQAFPRFYFLSNDELLEILSETKDPLRVQPFLRKIFEGINGLEFQKDMEVTAMISEEGEKVKFVKTFNPKAAQGNVERWLIDVENGMRDSLKDVLRKAFNAYAVTKRVDWVLRWPGQVVICIGSMYWTDETADAVRNSALKEYAQKLTDDLMQARCCWVFL
jgi:dynein heavy chain